MRFGPKYRNVCANVVASRSLINYQAFNNIFGKIGRNAPEEVLFSLIKSKCLVFASFVYTALKYVQ